MSVLDELHAARKVTPLDAGHAVFGDGTAGSNPGDAIGWALIGAGVLGTLATDGAGWPLGLLAVGVGLAAIGGKRVVESNLETMAEATQNGQEALNRSAMGGCARLVSYLVVAAAALVALFLWLAGAGLIAGVTL